MDVGALSPTICCTTYFVTIKTGLSIGDPYPSVQQAKGGYVALLGISFACFVDTQNMDYMSRVFEGSEIVPETTP